MNRKYFQALVTENKNLAVLHALRGKQLLLAGRTVPFGWGLMNSISAMVSSCENILA
jgi:hypothetical protein